MDVYDCFLKYKLSDQTLRRIEIINGKLENDIAHANPLWKRFVGKKKDEILIEDESDTGDTDESNDQNADSHGEESIAPIDQTTEFSSTQFYFTQQEKNCPKLEVRRKSLQLDDTIECLYESLEHDDGKLDFSQLEDLSSEDLLQIIQDLRKRLSPKGIYHFFRSMYEMSKEQEIKYINIICSDFMLPKIKESKEPSRPLITILAECVERFPDDIQKLVFIPILNDDLKDVTLMNTIANAFSSQRKAVLLVEFLCKVRELKPWHIPILQSLLSIKADDDTKDKLICLFSENAFHFSKDKRYGKLILAFLKLNITFSNKQQNILREIANIHDTVFKKPIENFLKNL
ncbi:hypothetical protein KM043_002026 [Ampulex compressa]|nr:hypothetical protein KM043_002026 [Ampulex compressa]